MVVLGNFVVGQHGGREKKTRQRDGWWKKERGRPASVCQAHSLASSVGPRRDI